MNCISVTPITKGWSKDRKYCVTDEEGKKFLLRISAPEHYEAKKVHCALMERVATLGVPMCKPIRLYRNESGEVCFLQSWIDGEDAEELLPSLSLPQQYAYGREAGRLLRLIHTVPAPENAEPWESRFNKKLDRKLELYRDCPLKYENGEAFIAYIVGNRHLLRDRPQSYQHGDYHVGNMMIDKNGKLHIIDFDRDDHGDPWEEFNRIVWCAQTAPRFATGMVDGYFDGGVPEEFWALLALYISSNTLSSLPWAIPFGDEEVKTMTEQAKKILLWYDNMKRTVPTWYREEDGHGE